MIRYTQSKVVVRNSQNEMVVHGNCYATAIACLLEIPPVEVPNVETLFDIPNSYLWQEVMHAWLHSKGFELLTDNGFRVFHDGTYGVADLTRHRLMEDRRGKYYLVSGRSARGVMHMCIYQDGKMVHDPHPTAEGIMTEEIFEVIEPISATLMNGANATEVK